MLLVLPELQPCRHPLLLPPVPAVVQPAEKGVQFPGEAEAGAVKFQAVLLALLPMSVAAAGVTTAVEVSVVVRVEVLGSETEDGP
jgi:hypothetical protein